MSDDSALDLSPILRRIAAHKKFLKDDVCFEEQKHLDDGSRERVYWHYGYLVALRDILRYLGVEGAGKPIPTVKTETEDGNKSSAPSNVRKDTAREWRKRNAKGGRLEADGQFYQSESQIDELLAAYRRSVLEEAIGKVDGILRANEMAKFDSTQSVIAACVAVLREMKGVEARND